MSGEKLYTKKDILYFRYRGEINTDIIIRAAVERSVDKNIDSIVVASETGRSALRALKIIKEYNVRKKVVVVTHYPSRTWGPKGDIPIGITGEIRRVLVDEGAVVIQGTRPLVGFERSISGGWEAPTPNTYIDSVLGGIFGQGIKIAIEVAVMATDAGCLSRGEEVVSLGGTYKGLDSAIIAKTCYSHEFLREFEVLEIIGKPYYPRNRYPEYEDDGWRGDLDQYYREIDVNKYLT